MREYLFVTVFGLSALALVLAACAPDASHGTTTFRIQVGKPEDTVTAQVTAGQATVEVNSPSGIGGADIQVDGVMPSPIILRFHLKGLEELRLTYGLTTIVASMSSFDDHAVREKVSRSGGAEEEITASSPYWMAMRVAPDGAIEVEAPPDLLQSGTRSFSMRWIDFYR